MSSITLIYFSGICIAETKKLYKFLVPKFYCLGVKFLVLQLLITDLIV